MPDRQQEQPPGAPRDRAHADRGARLDEVFGAVLPETTSDERGDDRSTADARDDAWYLDNRPPHH